MIKRTVVSLWVLLVAASCMSGAAERMAGDLEDGSPPDGLRGPSIYGYVVDDSTGAAVEAAEVRVVTAIGRQLVGGSVTSRSGEYAIPVPEPGSYRIGVSHIMYATDATTVEVGGTAERWDFSLARFCFEFHLDLGIPAPCG